MELPGDVLERCRRGDEAAFRALFAAFQDRVYALCAALAGPDADDLTQETFVRVHRAIGGFDPRGPASLAGWILTIARRLCANRARDRRTRGEVELEPEAASLGCTGGPDGDLERARLRRRLQRAIERLPEEQRAVIALREWDGLSYEEIAGIEAVPVGTIRSRLARAREALRAALDDEVQHATE